MLTDGELEWMRATSVDALPDTVTITRPASIFDGTLNTSTGVFTADAATSVYSGAARIRPAGQEEQTMIFGETQATEIRYVLTLPHDAPALLVDDVVTATVSSDPNLSVMVYRVTRVPSGSWLLDRRVGIERVTS